MKLRIILLIFLALGSLTGQAFAQRKTVPKNEPLQPANQPVIYDFSDSVNTPGSQFHQDPVVPVVTDDQVIPEGGTPVSDTQPGAPAGSVVAGQQSTFNYWILLFAGLAGLMIALVWGYLRFARNP